jgi:DNA-binding beta-propeller fold protein YncE
MAFRPGTGNLYVVHSDQIEVVDEDAMEVTATLDIGGRGPAFSVTGSELYLLSDDRDSLMLLDPSTGDIRASAGAGFPREFLCVCTVTRSGYVYAAITDPSLDTGGIYQLDAATLALSDSMISDWQYGWLCSIPGRDELYYYCSEAEGSNILVVSIPDLEIAGEAEQLIGLSGMCAHPSGNYVLCIVQYYGYRDSW